MNDAQMVRYTAAMHAVQSAIAIEISTLGDNGAGADSKHLRVGINSAMAEHSAIVGLLIEKGVFTADQYYEAVVKAAEREAENMRQHAIQRCKLPPETRFG